jgi:hypothetical protein
MATTNTAVGTRLIRTHRGALLWGCGGVLVAVPFMMALGTIVVVGMFIGRVIDQAPIRELLANNAFVWSLLLGCVLLPVAVLAAILLPLTQRGLRWPLFGWLVLGSVVVTGVVVGLILLWVVTRFR